MKENKNQQPLILVTGATGAQGEAVTRALLREDKFRVRILTRNPASHKARLLQRAGAEIATGDFENQESLSAALQDVYGVFAVTGCGEDYEREYQQGKKLVDAVSKAAVKHFVLVTQPGYAELSHGHYPVPSFDVKAALEKYTREKKIPATFIHPAFYYENFFGLFPLQKDNNGGYYFGFPQGNTRLAMTSVEDLGPMVTAVFNDPGMYKGKKLGLVGADLACDEYAAIMSGVLNRTIYYTHIPRNIYAAYNFPGAGNLANQFEVQRLYIPNRQEDLLESYRVNPRMQPFESWVEKNRSRFISYFNSLFEVIVI